MRSVVLVALVLTACATRAEAPSTPSAAPTLTTTATAASTQAPTPSPSPSLRPNPTAGPGTYTNVALAYRVDLPAGWRRSSCQSSREQTHLPAVDTYTTATIDAESGTDTGPAQDVVTVRVEDTEGKTPLQWLESGKMGFSTQSHFERTTFDGKEAARLVTNDTGKTGAIVVAARGRMYAAQYGLRSLASEAGAMALMLSLHLLSDTELSDARTLFASPTPVAARSVEDVADALARGFAQKDTTVLASVSGDCLQSAAESAGGSFSSTPKFLTDLRAGFARGLTVTVRPRPIDEPQPGTAYIGATWMEASGTRNAKLMLRKIDNAWYWDGVLFLLR